MFHELFKDSIYPELKNDTGFRVVSISGDKDRSVWLSSIKKGHYTDTTTGYVNLYTNGGAFNEPMFNYYIPNGYPFILLIDKKGEIVSRITNYSDYKELRKLISVALKE
jgi:hypothetical protein